MSTLETTYQLLCSKNITAELLSPDCLLVLGDCLDVLPHVKADCVVTDPPYGMRYRSGMGGHFGNCAIHGDESTALRDAMLKTVDGLPVLCFGNWRIPRPPQTKALLTWEKGPHVGMGDLRIPWKPNTEEIYVIGKGFHGHRGTSVLRHNAVSPNFNVGKKRLHPTQKPLSLLVELLEKCPDGTVCDPFMGSGTTIEAAIRLGRKAIGIELDPHYFWDLCVPRAKRALAERAAQLPFEEKA